MTITYKINGTDIKTYGVYVSASDGLLSRPKPKGNVSVNWADYNGTVMDLSKKLYESRDIDLDCFIKADTQADFLLKCNAFLSLFDAVGTHRLEVFIDNETTPKPLVFEVYLSDEISISKKWSSANMAGTFKLKLKEPEPIKRVLKYTRTSTTDKTVSITTTSAKLLNVYWGDSSHTYDISGTAQTITHDYTVNGTYYIIVTGNIDEITSLTTTGAVVWSKL
jgi:PKD repeat protein